MKTYIIGHQKPDTDSVVAVLAFKHLFDSQDCWNHSNSIACITHQLNPETQFIFNKFQAKIPKIIKASDIQSEDKVVLVDHNETSQRLEGLNQNQITDIFDHHKLNLNLNHPIFVTTKDWGSTNTIAWHLMNLYKVDIPQQLASLMLCAILSDTVGFKSVVTTERDKKAAQALAQKAKIKDIDTLSLEILKAKSDISSLSDEQIVTNDYKIYNFNNKKIFINQLETVEQKKLLTEKKPNLLKALEIVKQKENVDLAFIAISDILKVNTKLLILSDEEKAVAESAFNGQVKNNLLDIGSKLSRKKEITPAIEKALK